MFRGYIVEMIDLSPKNPSAQINYLIDRAVEIERNYEPTRAYIGGSIIGHPCERFLQYQFGESQKFPGRIYQIFEFGDAVENLMVKWFNLAGFNLVTEKPGGGQWGWSDGRFAGHADGMFVPGSQNIFDTPCLWECKSMNNKSWNKCKKKGVKKSNPIYAAQIAVYQHYLNLMEHPAIFTAMNKDNCEKHHERVPYDAHLAQNMIDRAKHVLAACDAGELLPRGFNDPNLWDWNLNAGCKYCDYQKDGRCWG